MQNVVFGFTTRIAIGFFPFFSYTDPFLPNSGRIRRGYWGASDSLGRVLLKFHTRKAFMPVKTLEEMFKKPRDPPTIDQVQTIVYKIRQRRAAKTRDARNEGGSSRRKERLPAQPEPMKYALASQSWRWPFVFMFLELDV